MPDRKDYVEGGKSITFTLQQEPRNHLEFQGAAYGRLTYLPASGPERKLAERSKWQERTYNSFAALEGGRLCFDNIDQEIPIQELAAYNITTGAEPHDEQSFSYTIRTAADPAEYPTIDELTR